SDVEFRQVVSGDVLDDLAAAPDHDAVGANDGDADQEIARRAIQMAPRSGSVARENAADRRAIDIPGIEREPLAPSAELRLESSKCDTGLDRRGEITGLVLEHSIEPLEPEDESDAARRRADTERGAAAPRQHGHLVLAGQRQDRADLFLRAGEHDRLG